MHLLQERRDTWGIFPAYDPSRDSPFIKAIVGYTIFPFEKISESFLKKTIK